MRAVIGGIVNRDGGPVDQRELELFAARARLPWGGKPRLHRGEGFGLVWIPAFPLDESGVRAASVDRFGGSERFAVVVDGTLDNRAELARNLGLPAEAGAPGSEPRLIAAACERWGADGAARLIGDFAYLAWDRRERRLLAARDAFGLRELFFREDGRQLQIASQCCMILDRPSLSDIDEEYVADFLATQEPWGPATPFKGIRRLQSGHSLTAATDRLDMRRFWEPDRPLLRYRQEEEYAEHFRAVFREAVERCLATGGRVWADLSGGLDSSSIVCIAQEILQGNPTAARDFATVTHVWDETPQCDERELVKTVVEKYGLVNHQVRCDDLFFYGAYDEARFRNEPHFGLLGQPMIRAIAELLRGAGVAVLMSGTRAEAVVLDNGMPPVHLVDLARGLRPVALVRELLRWQRGTHKPLANLLLTWVLKPLLGQQPIHRSMRRGKIEPWVNQEFARRMRLRDRANRPRADQRFHTFAQLYQYELLSRTEQGMARGLMEWSCEVRHPFLYRPLVELALAIPWEQKIAPREAKLLLRRSLVGTLPEPIRTRRTGAGPGAAMYKAFAKRWASIEPVIRSSFLVSMGFLDGPELSRTAELARFGSISSWANFLHCLAFEYWLRAATGAEEQSDDERRVAAGA
jgi:asparagine synthase (glutamine-hydrolysing)